MPKIELAPVVEIPREARPWLWWAQHAEDCKLAGMALPVADYDFGRLATLGLDTVVSLIGRPDYDPAPLELHTFELHDLAGGLLPPDRVREEEEVAAAVSAVCELLDQDHGVVVHCHAGVGRTGTVIASVLAARGHRPQDIVPWLDSVQRARGAHGWPESSWQLQQIDRFTRPAG